MNFYLYFYFLVKFYIYLTINNVKTFIRELVKKKRRRKTEVLQDIKAFFVSFFLMRLDERNFINKMVKH
jgi:hypothetical protein